MLSLPPLNQPNASTIWIRRNLECLATRHKLYGCHQVLTISFHDLLAKLGQLYPDSLCDSLEAFDGRYRVCVSYGLAVERDEATYGTFQDALKYGKRGCKGIHTFGADWWIELVVDGVCVLRRNNIRQWHVVSIAATSGDERRAA